MEMTIVMGWHEGLRNNFFQAFSDDGLQDGFSVHLADLVRLWEKFLALLIHLLKNGKHL